MTPADASPVDDKTWLRHTLATLAYRAARALRDAPEEFARFRAAPTARTPDEILAHMGDLLDWALHLAAGRHLWSDSEPLAWAEEVERFFSRMADLDAVLAQPGPLGFSAEKVFQGPVADALQHVGQIALLRRLAGCPIRGENFFKAEIVVGRVGQEQAAPRREFDA